MADLNVYTNDCDTVVAANIADAEAVLREYGYSDVDPESLDLVGDTEMLVIHCAPGGEPATPGDDGVAPVSKTAREWAAARGRGFLCTTETG